MEYKSKSKRLREYLLGLRFVTTAVLLLCLGLMNQAAFAQTAFTDTDWNRFSYTTNNMTLTGAQYVCDDNDIDNDNDGLIEICYLENLDAVRHQLSGAAYQSASGAMPTSQGCPSSGCRGYELVRDLDFKLDASYRRAANKTLWTTSSAWQPIEGEFSGIFEGNGHTISNLTINRKGENLVGLFVNAAGTINGVGLLDVEIRGRDNTGGLVGRNEGTISNSYSTGQIIDGSESGGLVGFNNFGTITNSYSSVRVRARVLKGHVGGLVGVNEGKIIDSYSSGHITGYEAVGGLVGQNNDSITNSYSIGQVRGTRDVGGLAGMVGGGKEIAISKSYWDITASKVTVSAGGTSQTTTELQTPTDASDIYSTWSDAEWDFGTAYQYPAIKYTMDTPTGYQACGRSQQPPCGALLSGAKRKIKRFAIATQTSVEVNTVEGETVVLNASQGNLKYNWVRISDPHPPLKLNTTDTAELWFVMPEDFVRGNVQKVTLMFRLTVGIGAGSRQQTVSVVVAKIDNGNPGITLGSITQANIVLEAPRVESLPDPDGMGDPSDIRYQWQKCPTETSCSSWGLVSGSGTSRSYQIPKEEGNAGNQFRVQLTYQDMQGYPSTVFSEPRTVDPKELVYPDPLGPVEPPDPLEPTETTPSLKVRLKVFLEGALQ